MFLWLRHGQRPGRMTLAGAGLAALGLVLVLDLVSGADLSARGVLWALGAMVGCAIYFIISADEDNGLPPLALAWGGLVVGAVVLAALGVVGLLPMQASTDPASYAGGHVAWWVPLVVLGLVSGRAGLRRRHRCRPPARARGWRRSWRCSRWWRASAGRGCCSTSSRAQSSCSAAC